MATKDKVTPTNKEEFKEAILNASKVSDIINLMSDCFDKDKELDSYSKLQIRTGLSMIYEKFKR